MGDPHVGAQIATDDDVMTCGESALRPVIADGQRGRGGISFTVAAGDQPGADAAVVALTPVPDGVMLTALRDGASAPADSVLLRARAEPLGLSADARQ